MTLVVSLYGGPSTGKTTTAARLFSLLKDEKINAEYVQEYVKGWAWQKRHISNLDQFYLFGKQLHRETELFGKVDVIVTDSPVYLSQYYSSIYCTPHVRDAIAMSCKAFYAQSALDGVTHLHVNLTRTKPYNPAGRYQSEEEAKAIDGALVAMLQNMNVPTVNFPADKSGTEALLNHVLALRRELDHAKFTETT